MQVGVDFWLGLALAGAAFGPSLLRLACTFEDGKTWHGKQYWKWIGLGGSDAVWILSRYRKASGSKPKDLFL